MKQMQDPDLKILSSDSNNKFYQYRLDVRDLYDLLKLEGHIYEKKFVRSFVTLDECLIIKTVKKND